MELQRGVRKLKELSVPEGGRGQEIYQPSDHLDTPITIEPGESVEVPDEVYEAHKDRAVFNSVYECGDCGREFDTEQGLNSHRSQTHDQEDEVNE